jgi:WD40 repeat protein
MGRDRRRQPQRVPLTRDIGNKARIRQRIDAQHYMIDIGSRVGSPAIGFYIGSLVLSEGELVLVTWREESDLYDIVGPVREPAVVISDVIGVGFQEVAGGSGQFVQAVGITTDGSLGVPVADPAVLPTATVDRIKWSPDGNYVAIAYDDKVDVYAWDGGWGALLDSVTIPDGQASGIRLGLAWNADGTLLAAAHNDAATGDGLTIMTWDGTTLTDVHNQTLPGFLEDSGTAVVWHPTNINRVFVAAGTTAFTVLVAYDWDGAILTLFDSQNQGGFCTDMMFRPDGLWIGMALLSDRIGAVPWDEITGFGTTVVPGTLPANANSHGVAWSADGTKIVLANDSTNIVGYTFDGTFGSRVNGTLAGTSPVANDIAGHPLDSNLFAIAVETSAAAGKYLLTMTFDGTAWADVDSIESIGAEHFDGISVGFPPGAPIVPTEQLDASEITYTPIDESDWPTVPDDAAEALDELADRLTGLSRIVDLPLNSFVVHTGTPAYAQVGTNMHAWALDDTIDELVVYSFTVPPKYVSGGFFRLYYVMASATTNEVVVSADALPAVEGDNFDAAGTAATVADTVQAGASDNLGVVDVTPAVTYAAGDRVRAIAGRLGADGSDNAAGDMWLVGVEFRYTAAL